MPTSFSILENAPNQRPPFSLYYEDPLALYYAVARAHRHASPRLATLRDTIVDRVRKVGGKRGTFANPLCAALAASVLLTYESCPKLIAGIIDYVLKMQREDGGWNAYPFYNVWGSEELTTAFCIEALARFRPQAAKVP